MTQLTVRGPGMGKGTAGPINTEDLLRSSFSTDMATATRRVQAEAQRAGFNVGAVEAATSIRQRYAAGDTSVLPNYHNAATRVADMEKSQ